MTNLFFSLMRRKQIAVALFAIALVCVFPVSFLHAAPSNPPRASMDMVNDADIRSVIEKDNADIEIQKIEVEWEKARLQRALKEDQHFMFTLYKQSVLDVILIALVILVVTTGLWLSYRQFERDEHPGKRSVGDGLGGDTNRSTIKISKDGVELSSSVIGLFILLASMFVFFTFVDRVYDIKLIGADPKCENSNTTK